MTDWFLIHWFALVRQKGETQAKEEGEGTTNEEG
jgi:hypothetical protein